MNLEQAREVLVAHSKSKRNGSFDAQASKSAKLLNPICGDHVELRAEVKSGVLYHVGFAAKACAICTAAASLLSEAANGWTTDKVSEMRAKFERAVTDEREVSWPDELNAFRSFEHLRVNPRRRACAILPWLALEKLTHQE